MKNVLLSSIFCCFLTVPLFAQVGVQMGLVGISGEAFPTADNQDKLGGASGFTIGVFYQHPVGDKFVFQPAINLLNKGWKDDLDDGAETTTMRINYLELPLQMVYTGGTNKGFFAGAGPSLLFGLGGKYKIERSGNTVTEEDYTFNSGKYPEKPLTIGLNAMVGYNLNGFMIGVNYGMGLSNRNPPGNMEFGNQSHFALRIGYLFSKK